MTDPRTIAVVNLPIAASLPGALPNELRICGSSDDFKIEAAAAGADPKSPRKFSMTAYTGVPMRLGGWPYPVVASIEATDQGEGLRVPRQSVPIDRDHNALALVGHTTAIEKSQQRVYASGVISGHHDTEQTQSAQAAREVLHLAAGGFPWQASIFAEPNFSKVQFVDKGESVKINGRNVSGPCYAVWESTLQRISFTANGADGNTTASVAASTGRPTVNDQWIIAQGFDPKTLNDKQRAFLQAAWSAEQGRSNPPPTPPAPVPPVEASTPPPADPVVAMRTNSAREVERIASVRRICASAPGVEMEIDDPATPGKKKSVLIEAHAIAEGWNEERTELAVIRASRPTGNHTPGAAPFGYVASRPEVTGPAIEAAMLRVLGHDVNKLYQPPVLEASDRHFRDIGLQQVILIAAAQNGYHVAPGSRISTGNIREVLQYAFMRSPAAIKASSAFSLPGILGNVANKQLLAGYMEEDDSWREISRVATATNFHTRTYYRMLDNMEYEQVGPDGKIKHGSVGSESYTATLKTFAKMFALDRTSIINDDLGALDDIRARLGRGAKKKFNNVFWTNMLANHNTFFTSGRGNYITGSTTTLLTDGVGLGLALKAFRTMKSPSTSVATTDDGGKRVNGRPSLLLVPPELEYAADQLFMGEKLTSTEGPTNTYRNKYRPVVNAWLSDSAFTGYSTTAWYLFRAATDMAMMIVSFLNGQQTPTVESTDADFDTLGIQFRGYHDFDANQAEYLCGVKSKGAA